MTSAIEDKVAIEELIGRYNQAIDEGRFEDFLACWCEDGVFDGLGGPYVGKDAIRTFTDSYDERYRLRLNGLRHFTVNIVPRIDGDRATSRSHLQLVTTGSKGAQETATWLANSRISDSIPGDNGAAPSIISPSAPTIASPDSSGKKR